MVTPEELEALDLMCWLGHGDDAALLGYCNQSTISRRSSNALRIFNLKPSRELALHPRVGESPLLRMEREVHQLYRLRGRGRLRLHAPYWASRLLENQLGEGWIVNPAREKESVGEALTLLEHRVIDALIAENSQRPADDDSAFVCFDLYKAPLRLCTVKADSNPLCHEQNLSKQDIGALASVKPLPFLSRSTKDCVFQLFNHLYGEPTYGLEGGQGTLHQPAQVSFFLTPSLDLPEFSSLQVVDCDCAFEATESLVVLRELASDPRIGQLREYIFQSYLAQINHHPGVAIH